MFVIPGGQNRSQRWSPLTRRRKTGKGREEAGVVLVIYTLAIVAVLLFAALAIDLGNFAQTKQHAQDAADAAALSAVWDLASIFNGGSAANDETQAVTDVDNYLQHNYPSVQTPLTPTSCAPGSLPSGVTMSTLTDCVGFYSATNMADPNTIVVVIPNQQVSYTFGRVGGNTSQAISAIAEASLTSPGAGANLPFAFCINTTSPPTNCASGGPIYGLGCLKNGSHGSACTGASVGPGNFGGVYSPRYLIYPGSAGNGGNDPVLKTDIDEGIDHPLLINPNAPSQSDNICDYTSPGNTPGCTGTPEYNDVAPYANGDAVVTTTGQELNESGDALFDGYSWNSSCPTNSFIPRFNHPNGFQASGVCSTDNPTNGFTPACPCLSTSTASSLGSTFQLNGVHVADYLISSRTDAATVVKGSDSVADTSITAADQGSVVTGTGIPAGTYVGTVTAGSGFLLSSSPTSQVNVLATDNGISVTITTNSNTPTNSSLYQLCYQGQGPPGDTSPSPTGDPIDHTSGGQNVWSFGDPSEEDGCLSTQIQALANSGTCSTTPVPASCQIFASSIAESPRFGMVPVVESVTGKKGDAIAGFDDVFIYQTGESGGKVDSISAWIFPSWMVQTGPNNSGPGGPASQGPLTANLCSLAATPGPNC